MKSSDPKKFIKTLISFCKDKSEKVHKAFQKILKPKPTEENFIVEDKSFRKFIIHTDKYEVLFPLLLKYGQKLPQHITYLIHKRLSFLNSTQYKLDKSTGPFIKEPFKKDYHFVPKFSNKLSQDNVSKYFASADIETILDSRGRHQAVAATAIFDGPKNYTAGKLLANEKHPVFQYLSKGDFTQSLQDRFISKGLHKTEIFLEPEKIDSVNLEKYSNSLLLDFIKSLDRKALEILPPKSTAKIIVYFHNLGKFDGILLLNALYKQKEKYTLKIETEQGQFHVFAEPQVIFKRERIYSISLQHVILRDSFLLLPGSLENFGQSFCQQGKVKFSPENLHPHNYKDLLPQLKVYLCHDAALLLGVLLHFRKLVPKMVKNMDEKSIEKYLCGSLDITHSLSLPSLSYKIFRHFYLKETKIHISTKLPAIHQFINRSFMGGTSEVYIPWANEGVFVYDINSSYPHVMATKKLPVGKPKWFNAISKANFSRFFGFVDVTVNVPKHLDLTPLTIRYRDKDEFLLSPTGTFRGVFFSEELKQSLDVGVEILEFHGAVAYDKAIIFKDYIERLFSIKQQSEGAEKLIAKELMNRLYGRLSLGPEFAENKTLMLPQEILQSLAPFGCLEQFRNLEGSGYALANINLTTLRQNNQKFSRSQITQESLAIRDFLSSSEPFDFLVARQISAAISSYSRMALFQVQLKLKELGITVFYSETDSVHVNARIPNSTGLVGKGLGQLKFEGHFQEGIYLGPKTYGLQGPDREILKCAGTESSVKTFLTFEDLKNIYFAGGEGEINRSVEDSFTRNLNSLQVEQKEFVRTLNFSFKKRAKVFKDNKWINTRPWNMQEDSLDENMKFKIIFQSYSFFDLVEPTSLQIYSFTIPASKIFFYIDLFFFGLKESSLVFEPFTLKISFQPGALQSSNMGPITYAPLIFPFFQTEDLENRLEPIRKDIHRKVYGYKYSLAPSEYRLEVEPAPSLSPERRNELYSYCSNFSKYLSKGRV